MLEGIKYGLFLVFYGLFFNGFYTLDLKVFVRQMGISWEKLFFSWEFLGTFRFVNERVTKIFGNFVGKTFFFVGISWEKVNLKNIKNLVRIT